MKKINFSKILSIVLAFTLTGGGLLSFSWGETLDSTNYRIKDASFGGTGIQNSDNYSLIGSFNPIEDARTSSGSYTQKAGFPNGIIANVPDLHCFAAIVAGHTCNNWVPVCGYPGCYDRAKIEINPQSNPLDTLYLVKIVDVDGSIAYYLQSDHTLSLSFDIGDFMTICDLEGRDPNDSECDDAGDPDWNASLQKYNVFGLKPDTEYQASISALNGDFTGTDFGPATTETTSIPTLALDLDIQPTSNPTGESASPYNIAFGELISTSVSTAENLIWTDINTNSISGINLYVKDVNEGLYAFVPDSTIPSESEDLGTDPNNNGGYGLKTYNYSPSEDELGPLIRSATYNTGGGDTVGALTTSTNLLFYTDTTGGNYGPIKDGRGAVYLKARSSTSTPTGNYSDTITFTLVANF